jgi:hypothetical protein
MAAPSYPLEMPTTPNFIQSNFGLQRFVSVGASPYTGYQQAHEWPFANWQATLTLPPMNRTQAREWQAFFMKLHGRKGSFLLGDPDAKNPTGNIDAGRTVLTTAAVAVGSYDVPLDGLGVSITSAFRKGDYIQFGSGSTAKLHMIVANSSSDEYGAATVTVEPAIKVALSDNSPVTYVSPQGVFRLTDNLSSWDANNIGIYGISFSCNEVL